MTKADLLHRIQEYKDTPVARAFRQLLEVWIDDLRIKNDTASTEGVLRNQGAIAELKIILKQTKVVDKFEEKDGAYMP